MLIVAVVLVMLMVLLAVTHLVVACYFRTVVMLSVLDLPDDHDQGLASVLMSVRGCDPGLKKTLIQLLSQEYGNYQVHLVVDHRSDAAWNVCQQVKCEFDVEDRLTIHEMRKPLKSCGLKCSSLLQALNHIDPRTRYLVLIDADVIPHATWLSQLIAPLKDPKIGVVTGNQWYEPEQAGLGTCVRSLWNAGALVPTALLNNPWAGTFAMRMEDVRRAGLKKIWRKSIVDDGPIRQALQPLGLKIHFSPALIMVNRDRCTFPYVRRYISRMLTWSRMYESTFINTLLHAAITSGVIAGGMLLMAWMFWQGDWQTGAIIAGGLLLGSVLTTTAFFVVRSAVDYSLGLRGESLRPISLVRRVQLYLLTPVTQVIYGYCCIRAALTQRIQWRQITYEIQGTDRIKMLQYRPWVATEHEEVQSEVSI